MGPKNERVLGKEVGREKGIIPSQFPLETPGQQILPALACSWFCHPAITNACLGNPCAFSPGNDQTPVLYLNASSAKEGEIILFQCAIDWQFPATRVVFCKNGQEEFSLKAQQGKVIYALVLNITSRSAGTYKCGYQQRNESNWVRNSALSAPQTLSVPGETQHQGGEGKRFQKTAEAGAVCCSRQGMDWGGSPSGVFPLLRGSPYREKAALKGCPHPCSSSSAEAWGCAVPMQREQELGMLMDPGLSLACSKICPVH